MIAVRLDKKDWGRAWRAMIAIAPVRRIAADPIYEVLPAHLELLSERGLPYEIVKSARPRKGKPRLKRSLKS